MVMTEAAERVVPDVPCGFKQTDAGLIPEDWGVRLLPEICRFRGGKAHEQYVSELGNFACVNSKFIASDGRVVKYATHNFCPARKGEILMVMSDLPNGKALAKAFIVDRENYYAVNQRVCALSPYKDSSRYLYYALDRHPYFLKFDDGVNQTHLLNPVFMKCSIVLPPTIAEQEAIAEALSDADALIGGLEQLIAKKRAIKQGAMQELLTGKTRLPGFSGEWPIKKIADVAPLQRGFDLPTANLRPGPHPVVYSNGICAYHAANQVCGPGVVTGRSGTIGRIIFINEDYWPHNTTLWVTTFKGNDPLFIFYLYQNVGFERFASGSGVPTLNRNDAHSYPVAIPANTEEQTAIADILSDMDAEITALEDKLAKARQIKQGMMQELLTGRVRLV